MAILTLAQALQAARIVTSTDNIPASITATATPLYEGAVDAINRYASGAPDNTKNLALERLFGYLWEEDRTGGRRSRYPLVDSGAASILTPYRTRRAGVINPTTARSTSQPSSPPSNGQGMPGPQGPIGPAGPQGATGPQGPAGPAGQGVPTGGTDGQVLTKQSSTDYDTAWEDAAAGQGGGLTQSQVDGRINTLIPPNRRIPSYAIGDANEVLKVAADGNSLTFAPESGGSGGAVTSGVLRTVAYTITRSDSGRTAQPSWQSPGFTPPANTDYIAISMRFPTAETFTFAYPAWFIPIATWNALATQTQRAPTVTSNYRVINISWRIANIRAEYYIQIAKYSDGSMGINPRWDFLTDSIIGRPSTSHILVIQALRLSGATGPAGSAGAKGDKGDKGDPGTAGVGTGGTGVPTGGTTGQVLGKKSDTNYDIGWQDASTASGETLTRRTALPAIAGFNDGDLISLSGELYELVANTEDSNIYRGTIAANAAGDTGYFGDMTFRFQAVSPFNMRANFLKTGLPTAPANLYVKYHSGSDYADIVLTRSSGSDTSTTWGYVHSPGTPGLEAPTAGDDFDLTVFSDSAYSTAQSIHAASRWEQYDRNDPDLNPLALANNSDRWPKSKLPADTAYGVNASTNLLERTPGLTLTSTTADFNVGNAPYYWSNPGVDLDDHPHGEFHCSLELTILPTSDVNMGFVQGKANQLGADRQVALSNVIFASDIAELDDYVVGTNIQTLNGLNVFRQTVYSGATIVGHYTIIMVHDSNNNVGYHVFWDGQAGSTGATFNAELRVSFTPSDAASGGGGGAFKGFLNGASNTGVRIRTDAGAGNTNWVSARITPPSDANLMIAYCEEIQVVPGTFNWTGDLIIPLDYLRIQTRGTVGGTTGGATIRSWRIGTSNYLLYAALTDAGLLLFRNFGGIRDIDIRTAYYL